MNKSFKKLYFVLFILMISIAFANASNNNLIKIYKQLGLTEKISYSADMAIQTDIGQGANINFKMFYKNGNLRTEGNQAGMNLIMIIRADGTMYSFNDAMKMWVKTDMGQIVDEGSLPDYKKIGDEDLDGKKCIKYEALDSVTGFKSLVWVSDGMIYKNEAVSPQGQKQIVYYQNIKKENFDDAMFMPPSDVKVQDMSEMMKGLVDQMKNQGSQEQ